MILVTLGTTLFPFNRPLEWVSALIKEGLIREPILVQYGASDPGVVMGTSIEKKEYLSSQEMEQVLTRTRLVISHAGQGSIRMLIKKGIPFVLVPRLKKYKEHIDDHQLNFCLSMSRFGVQGATDFDTFRKFYLNPPQINPNVFDKVPSLATYLLQKYPA